MIKKFINFIFNINKKVLSPIKVFFYQLINFKSLSKDYGQWRSIKEGSSVDCSGYPIPWYTYPAIEFLSHLNFKQLKVFEYGSGNSTKWWSKRCKKIKSVEHNEAFYNKIKVSLKNKNVICKLEKNPQKYILQANNNCDIYIIDGIHRQQCLEYIVNINIEKKYIGYKKKGLMIILDNSDWFPRGVNFLIEKLGWMQIDFHGFGPINKYTWTTTIFVNPHRYKEISYCSMLKSKCGLVKEINDD